METIQKLAAMQTGHRETGIFANVFEQLQESLKKRHDLYRDMIDNMADTVYTVDLKGNFTFVSPQVKQLTGYSAGKILSMNIAQLFAPDFLPIIKENHFKTGLGKKIPPFDIAILNSERKLIPVQIHNSPVRDHIGNIIGIQGIARNTNGNRSVEKHVFLVQKMEAMGALASGIAHDFNNLLTAVLANLYLLRLEITPKHSGFIYVLTLEEVLNRAKDLVKQLLLFGKPSETEKHVLSLNQMVEKSLSFLQALIPLTIHIEKKLSSMPCTIKAEPAAITQIITNLSINARDAMEKGGTLLIETSVVSIDNDHGSHPPGAYPGKFCLLKVSDTGSGISRKIKDRIFEPFFTTKAEGKGSGLGLSVVHNLVNQMGGWIEMKTELGKGTEFGVYIPLIAGEALESPDEYLEIRNGYGTILLADDEMTILNFAKKILERCGYNVMVAGDGNEVIKIFHKHGKEISIAILDLIMPGGGGFKCMEEIHKIYADLPVIIMSGYAQGQFNTVELGKARAFLSKPFSPHHLAAVVKEIMEKQKADLFEKEQLASRVI